MRFNLNDKVRVRLNDRGRQIHADNWRRLWESAGCPPKWEYRPPRQDDEGFTRWQMWEFMQEFGPHVHMGMLPAFDLTIEVETTDLE